MSSKNLEVIEAYLEQYERQHEFFERLSQMVADRCEELLNKERGIRSIISYRAKRTDRLRSKLLKRQVDRTYATPQCIEKDVPDLAGVRVALYFPSDAGNAKDAIVQAFDVQKIKSFPNPENPSSGYKAEHFRVKLKPGGIEPRWSTAIVEIQVASVLMHAWAEVEHDLVYKPQQGELTESERVLLGSINKLVLSGEDSLNALQLAIAARSMHKDLEFRNHYELGSYLDGYLEKHNSLKTQPVLNNLQGLFETLKALGANTPNGLDRLVDSLDNRDDIEQCLLVKLATERPEALETYKTFVKVEWWEKWIKIERTETGWQAETTPEAGAAIGRALADAFNRLVEAWKKERATKTIVPPGGIIEVSPEPVASGPSAGSSNGELAPHG